MLILDKIMDHCEISNPASQNVVLHKYVSRSIESLDTIDFESTNSLKMSKSCSYELNTFSNEGKFISENENQGDKSQDLDVRGRRSSRPLEFATERPCSTPKNISSLVFLVFRVTCILRFHCIYF